MKKCKEKLVPNKLNPGQCAVCKRILDKMCACHSEGRYGGQYLVNGVKNSDLSLLFSMDPAKTEHAWRICCFFNGSSGYDDRLHIDQYDVSGLVSVILCCKPLFTKLQQQYSEPSELKRDLKDVRNVRNKLMHEPRYRLGEDTRDEFLESMASMVQRLALSEETKQIRACKTLTIDSSQRAEELRKYLAEIGYALYL